MSFNDAAKHAGFTLVEVLLALVIMAMIALLSAQAFNTASTGSAATREAMDRIAAIDRTFVLIETDLRNAINKPVNDSFNQPLPPLFVASSDDYWMTVMRGGLENPLFLPRSEEVRVGYRYMEETIWRDTWYNPRNTDQDDARAQKILTGVTMMSVRVLSSKATSLAAGPWLQDWPDNSGGHPLPPAIEVTLELEDMGEVVRLFSILPDVPRSGATGAGSATGGTGGSGSN